MRPDTATVGDLARFDTVIDVRSPAEFAEDHVPGAVNCPVLGDEERARIGTLYKQVSPFAARKAGAALVARNIAHHLETRLAAYPREWRPLVYCWRGGQRSGAMTIVLRQVGWEAKQLEGGYKAYRRDVIAELETLPARFRFEVVCGLTGSGKSRLLRTLAARGAQVLDLEALAAHRGSLLGDLPGHPQPSQKAFESAVRAALASFDPARTVFTESESRKIGQLRVPAALMDRMRASPCVTLRASVPTRVALLLEEYGHFTGDVSGLVPKLQALVALQGRETVERWLRWVERSEWPQLVADLLERHYDPAYSRSITADFAGYAEAPVVEIGTAGELAFADAADALLATHDRVPV